MQYPSTKITLFVVMLLFWFYYCPRVFSQEKPEVEVEVEVENEGPVETGGEEGEEEEIVVEEEEEEVVEEVEDEKLEFAKSHFKKGVEFFKSESYEAALVEFLESYELNPVWAVKYNIAVCYMKMNQYVSSLTCFREYLSEGGEKIPEERMSKVHEDISRLEGIVGRIMFCCEIEGSQLVINDVEKYDEIPQEGLMLDPGIHKVQIIREGYKPYIFQLKVVAGEEKTVEVKLEPERKVEPIGDGENGKKLKLEKSHVFLISGLAGFAAFGIGSITTGALVLTSRSRMKDEAGKCESTLEREDCPDAYKYYDRAVNLRLASNLLTAAAILSAATGVTLFFILRGKEKKAAMKNNVSATFFCHPGRLFTAGLQFKY